MHAHSFKHVKVLTSRVFHQSAQHLWSLLTPLRCVAILESKQAHSKVFARVILNIYSLKPDKIKICGVDLL